MACFVRYDVEHEFREAMEEAGFITKAQVIWDKVIHGMGDLKGDFAPCHENVIFATKGRFTFPGKRPKSVVRVQRVNAESLVHPNEKPVELLKYFVEHLSKEGDVILDPFSGSGPTLCAAKLLRRNFIGIEMEEEYVKIAEARINAVEGEKVQVTKFVAEPIVPPKPQETDAEKRSRLINEELAGRKLTVEELNFVKKS